MTQSRYGLALGAAVIEAARSAVGEQLPRYLPALQEPPPEIKELIARLGALDSVEQPAAEHRVVASYRFNGRCPEQRLHAADGVSWMRSPTKSRDVTIQLAASLIAASRWIGREVARMVTAQLLRRLAAYERSQRYS